MNGLQFGLRGPGVKSPIPDSWWLAALPLEPNFIRCKNLRCMDATLYRKRTAAFVRVVQIPQSSGIPTSAQLTATRTQLPGGGAEGSGSAIRASTEPGCRMKQYSGSGDFMQSEQVIQ